MLARLAAAGHLDDGNRPVPLRGGRTNRVWRIGARVLKLYGSETDNPLFPNDPKHEALVLSQPALRGVAPRLKAAGKDMSGRWLVYDHIAGKPWSGEPGPVARLLGELHARPVIPGLRESPSGSAALCEHGREILADCPFEAARQVMRLRPEVPGVPPFSRPVLLHSDPVPGNIVMADRGPMLIDWQCPAVGDPCEDLAIFLSPAMQVLYRGAPLVPAETEEFLAVYPDQEVVRRYRRLAPLYHWRMAAYCQWQASRGRTDYRRAMPAELEALGAYSADMSARPTETYFVKPARRASRSE